MTQIHIVTVHPQFIAAYSEFGVFRSAKNKKTVEIVPFNLRDVAADKHGTVDGAPFGGGDGMVLRPDVLKSAHEQLPEGINIYTGPRGKPFSQKDADELAKMLVSGQNLNFYCGRFGGVDERFLEKYIDRTYSLGDFVLSGGELPVLSICDAVLRLLPGVLGNDQSAEVDSFSEKLAGLLEAPSYTKPRDFEGCTVPEVLLSGDHQRIDDWRKRLSQEITRALRPDLFKA